MGILKSGRVVTDANSRGQNRRFGHDSDSDSDQILIRFCDNSDVRIMSESLFTLTVMIQHMEVFGGLFEKMGEE